MRKYAIVNKSTGNISCIIGWGDDRDLPTDYPIGEDETIITIENAETSPIRHDCYKYDFTIGDFVEFIPPEEPKQPIVTYEERISALETIILQLTGVI